MHIKKGDTVKVLSGEEKGKEARVLEVDVKNYRAYLEGLKVVKKHTKPNAKEPDGGIIEKEASIHLSKLMLVDPKTGESTRVGRKRDDEGNLVRYSKKSGEVIK